MQTARGGPRARQTRVDPPPTCRLTRLRGQKSFARPFVDPSQGYARPGHGSSRSMFIHCAIPRETEAEACFRTRPATLMIVSRRERSFAYRHAEDRNPFRARLLHRVFRTQKRDGACWFCQADFQPVLSVGRSMLNFDGVLSGFVRALTSDCVFLFFFFFANVSSRLIKKKLFLFI